MRKHKIGYMCNTAFDCELEHTQVEVYPTVKALVEGRGCTDECGYIKVSIQIVKVLQKEKAFKNSVKKK